ncbi:signal recognition particle SEC65 subunit [Podospora conica]|nr:signal recognition particle SEC65 subunit [Schizothecium conicum]
MPSHPRVEEVEDSSSEDANMSDPSEDDIDDFTDTDILRARPQPTAPQQPPLFPPSAAVTAPPSFPQMTTTTDATTYASHQCLYPLYFDARRSRAQGRRVPLSLAVLNPLATEIVSACAAMRLPSVFEAGKLHPKDWANPGRVKVDLRGGQHAGQTVQVKNKHHLYVLVARWLVAHPTTEGSASLRVVVRGAPPPPEDGGKWPRPAVPRGWKVGELLPYYSPAMTGGGVSENFLKDMMKEMGGAGGGAGDMASMLAQAAGAGGGMLGGGGGSGSGEGKKEKKKKGK